VLIVGGGPVGLTLAIDLAWRGVECLVIKARAQPTTHPKATLPGARGMGLFRRFDRLDETIHDAAIRQDDDHVIVFTDRLSGHALSRFRSPGQTAMRACRPATLARFGELQWSRYGKTRIGQQALQPVLLAEAGRRGVSPRHGARVASLTDRGDHVEAVITEGGAPVMSCMLPNAWASFAAIDLAFVDIRAFVAGAGGWPQSLAARGL
jgi:2-polyprenyl-6-methoxyphenol hydroxylase-like FAD-dependent oxidoreductase